MTECYLMTGPRDYMLRVVVADTRPVDEIRVEGLERVNEQVVVQSMETTVGAPLDIATLDLDMRRIYGRGDFEHVGVPGIVTWLPQQMAG